MPAKEIRLRVVEALQDDAYKGIARIDGDVMRQLDVKRGDVILIKGGRESVAIVDRAYPADIGEGIIRIDGIIRKNTKTGIGELVSVTKAEVKEAKKVTIAPAQQGIMVQASPEMFKKGLLGRVVVKADIVVLGGTQRRRDIMEESFQDIFDVFGDSFFGGFMPTLSQMKFVVVNAQPSQAVIITENTEIVFSPKAVEIVEEKIPEVNYEDIGGLSEEIKKIREMVELPLKHPEIFSRLGIEPPKGVLLHGPPGTGKTLLAKAVANESEANFILLNGPEIMSKWYGESEKRVRDLFEEAEKTAPTIIFIDEIDAIAPKREESYGEVERRVVSQLLTAMDGLKSRGRVVVIGATNRPNAIDPALRRPGRFDREISINVPDKDGRLSILKIHSRNMPIHEIRPEVISQVLPKILDEYLEKHNLEKDKAEGEIKNLKKSAESEEFLERLKSKLNLTDLRIKKLEKIKKLISSKEELEYLAVQLIEIYNTLELREDVDSRKVIIKREKESKESRVFEVVEEMKSLDLLKKEIWSRNSSFWNEVIKESVNLMKEELARITHGFVGADISALTKEAAMNVLRNVLPKLKMKEDEPIPEEILQELRVTNKDFQEALKIVRPSAMREVLVETPNVKWDDVGGLESTKQEMIEAIEWPMKYPASFKRLGIRPPRGILLYGPPGTGKTLLAKAVAKESEANFIQVKGPSLLSMWVGESEKGVRKIFERARQVSPCIIFFDEIDSLAARRGLEAGARVTEQVLNQLLAEMDGIEDLTNIIVVGATNRPDMLDPALLRPGRFDRILLVNVPDKKGRLEILKIHTKNMPLAKDVNIDKIAEETDGYVGADLENLAREAAMLALRENMEVKEVKKKYFDEAMKKVRASVGKGDVERYKKVEEQYLRSAKAALIKDVGYLG